jgi:hypothetical protein
MPTLVPHRRLALAPAKRTGGLCAGLACELRDGCLLFDGAWGGKRHGMMLGRITQQKSRL